MTNKYIPGDLCIVKGKVESVCEVDRDNDFSITTDQHPFIRLSEVKPIPLTSEILEKNGWKLRKHHERSSYDDVSWSSYHKPAETNISLIFYQEEKAFFPFLYHEEISEKPIQYVHQLQHLLFGLGLDSNFNLKDIKKGDEKMTRKEINLRGIFNKPFGTLYKTRDDRKAVLVNTSDVINRRG